MKINKPLYYILNLTWGLIMTFIGAVGALALLLSGRRPFRNGGGWCFRIGKNWGGVSFGLFYFVDEIAPKHTLYHEYGHSLQNAIWGPLMIPIIAIPSGIRYQIFNWRSRHHRPNPPYDSIWFEGQATRWGTETFDQW